MQLTFFLKILKSLFFFCFVLFFYRQHVFHVHGKGPISNLSWPTLSRLTASSASSSVILRLCKSRDCNASDSSAKWRIRPTQYLERKAREREREKGNRRMNFTKNRAKIVVVVPTTPHWALPHVRVCNWLLPWGLYCTGTCVMIIDF